MNHILKMSNAGGFTSTTRYPDMLAGNTVWNPYSPTGSYDALATVTVPSGGVSSVTFSNIPSTYTHLQIRYFGFASSDVWINFNGDTASNYSRHSLYGNGSSAAAYGGANDTHLGFTYTASNTNPSACIFDILDYANTNKYKTARGLNGDDQNGSGIIMLASGNWRSTSAITSFVLTGNFGQYSNIALYGVKA